MFHFINKRSVVIQCYWLFIGTKQWLSTQLAFLLFWAVYDIQWNCRTLEIFKIRRDFINYYHSSLISSIIITNLTLFIFLFLYYLWFIYIFYSHHWPPTTILEFGVSLLLELGWGLGLGFELKFNVSVLFSNKS